MKIDLTKLLGFRIATKDNHAVGAEGKAVRPSAKIGNKAGGKPPVDVKSEASA
jgi:carbohydrate-selective porin OprB